MNNEKTDNKNRSSKNNANTNKNAKPKDTKINSENKYDPADKTAEKTAEKTDEKNSNEKNPQTKPRGRKPKSPDVVLDTAASVYMGSAANRDSSMSGSPDYSAMGSSSSMSAAISAPRDSGMGAAISAPRDSGMSSSSNMIKEQQQNVSRDLTKDNTKDNSRDNIKDILSDDNTPINIPSGNTNIKILPSSLRGYSNIEYFTLNSYKTTALCSSVPNGDHVDLVFYWETKPVKWRCRVQGCNIISAEMSSAARHKLQDLVENKLVKVEFGPFNNYGRPLVILKKDGQNINNLLLTYRSVYAAAAK